MTKRLHFGGVLLPSAESKFVRLVEKEEITVENINRATSPKGCWYFELTDPHHRPEFMFHRWVKEAGLEVYDLEYVPDADDGAWVGLIVGKAETSKGASR